MNKKIAILLAGVMLLSFAATTSFAQEESADVITGVVEEVAEDGSYIVLDGQKLMVDQELLEYMNMETGDEVEVVVEDAGNGPVIMDFDYL